jgi:tetratricopeptide (TPR) repeat protein
MRPSSRSRAAVCTRARRIFDALLVIAPDDPVGRLGLAELALLEGDAELAIEHVLEALKLPGISAESAALALMYQARAEAGRDRRDAARENLARAERLDPAGPGGESARMTKEQLEELWKLTDELLRAAREAAEQRASGAEPGEEEER